MRGYGSSFDPENDFVLISHILAELRKELKRKMILKTAWTDKESIYGEMESQEDQRQPLLKNLITYVCPFPGAARNMVSLAEVPISVANGLLLSKQRGN